jgi:hypothetical protein
MGREERGDGMTKETLAKGFALICMTFPNLGMNEDALNVWARLLEDLEDNEFMGAVVDLCRNEKQIYPGTNIVALIRDRVGGDIQAKSLEALHSLEREMRRIGAYKTPRFADAAITMAVSRLGGWEHLCHMEADEWKFVKKDFERIYRDTMKNGIPNEVPQLIGTHERMNQIAGNDVEVEIVQVGAGRPRLRLV